MDIPYGNIEISLLWRLAGSENDEFQEAEPKAKEQFVVVIEPKPISRAQ